MKYEWKKNEKELYGAKKIPALVKIPKQGYIMIAGKGNPNDTDFSERVSVLYSVAYGVKMGYKAMRGNSGQSEEYDDFTVYPLEGMWQGKKEAKLIKENLEYTIMIRQPDFISKEEIDQAIEKVMKKKPSPLLAEVFFDTMQDGRCIEVLHVGSFDEEPESFQKMEAFSVENGLKRCAGWHREIYLNNAKRVSKSKLKTILRYQVE